MPPEQLPWDRRDFRKHERSASDPRFVNGGGGFGGRWRDHHHPHAPPPPSHPPPYHHHQNPQQPQRWYSDFRSSRPIPNGHSKQGGWHVHSDEAGHGFPPFGSRHNDRNFEDDGLRPLGFRGDGRYIRNSRESRGGFGHKEWRSPNWEITAGSSGPGKHTVEIGNHQPQENASCHKPAIPVTVLPSDQHKSDLKEKNEDRGVSEWHAGSSQNIASSSSLEKPLVELTSPKPVENVSLPYNGKLDDLACAVTVSPLDQHPTVLNEKNEDVMGADAVTRSVQSFEKENTLGSIDRRFLKWSRSGSLSSRCSFVNSSSSKGDEVRHTETGSDLCSQSMMPLDSPSTGVCVASIVTSPTDNTNSRKKPRLGWGEGLAKYERKKVEGPDNIPEKSEPFSIPDTEIGHSPPGNLLEKTPILASLPVSPTTPTSVTCRLSPGMDEHQSRKAVGADQISASIKSSEPECKEPSFKLESIDELSNLSSLVNELLQSNDQGFVETEYVKSTSLNKLLLWKVNALKALEVTESEIDSLETQFRTLVGDPRSCCPGPSVSVSSTGDCCIKPCSEMVNSWSFNTEPTLLKEAVPKDMNVGDAAAQQEDDSVLRNDGRTDVTLSNSLELVDSSPSELSSKTFKHTEYQSTDPASSCNFGQAYVWNMDHLYDSIISSNKDAAGKVSDDLNKILPSQWHNFDPSSSSHTSSFMWNPSGIKEKILKRRWATRFNEKVLILKYKVFQHFWKEGRVISVKKIRGKFHKKFGLSQNTCSSNRSSSHSRLLYSAGSLITVPAEEIVDLVNNLLSNFPFKPCRSTLKMPSLILDSQTKKSQFVSNNGLVDDPAAVENERSIINPWTFEEQEVFIDKLAAFGKDFRKIASFLDHKTIADCIDFYYKNHKSECFSRAKRKSDCAKKKSHSSTYLVGAGKRLYRDSNAVSLSILGEAANASSYIEMQPKYKSRTPLGSSRYQNSPRGEESTSQLPDNVDFYSNETAAVDVLAGICGSLSSEAMSSCITSSIDPVDGNQDRKIQRQNLCIKRPLTPDVTQCVDECSEESCEEIDSTDWTDEEKSMFIQAVSLYGKDFLMISRFMRTRSRDQCRIFFSKARKCLGLDLIQPPAPYVSSDNIGVGGGDTEGASVMGTSSSFCNIVSGEPFDGKPVKENKVSNGHEPSAEVQTMFVSSEVGSRPVYKQDNAFFATSNKITLKDSNLNHSMDKNGSCTSAEEFKDNDTEKTDSCMLNKRDGTADEIVNVCDGITSCMLSLQKDDASESMVSTSMLFPVPIKYQRNSFSGGDRQNVCSSGVDAVHSQRVLQTTECLSCHSFSSQSNPSESTHIPKGYPVSVTTCEGITWDGDNKTRITRDCGSKQIKEVPSDQHEVSSQQECDHASHQNDTVPQWIHSPGQNGTHSRCQSSVSVEDKSPRNGDVKLFGKVLVALESKSSPVESDDHGKCHKQESLKLNSETGTGFPHMPDSRSTAELHQISTQTAVQSNEYLPNGASVFSGKALSRCHGSPGASVLQAQDVLWTGNRAHFNSRDASTGSRVVVGGQCSSVSDPISVIKKHHYSKGQSVSVQGGNIVGDEDAWRMNGDVAR